MSRSRRIPRESHKTLHHHTASDIAGTVKRLANDRRYFLDGQVSCTMSKRIVELLKRIDIDHNNRHPQICFESRGATPDQASDQTRVG